MIPVDRLRTPEQIALRFIDLELAQDLKFSLSFNTFCNDLASGFLCKPDKRSGQRPATDVSVNRMDQTAIEFDHFSHLSTILPYSPLALLKCSQVSIHAFMLTSPRGKR